MTMQTSPATGIGNFRPPSPLWTGLAIAGALTAGVGSLVGLARIDRIYGGETESFIAQAVAQDLVNLVVVAPLLLITSLLARSGSPRAYLVWLGALAFTIYNYVIYTVSISFGPLFLVWVAALGFALFALIGGLIDIDADDVASHFTRPRQRFAAIYLIVAAALFGFLWLSDIVPSLLDGTTPQGAAELNLPTNPVHVLDLAFFLPAVLIVGIQLLRKRPLGYLAGPGLLMFLILTGLPILITPFISDARDQEPAWGVMGPIGVITVIALAALTRMLTAAVRQPTR